MTFPPPSTEVWKWRLCELSRREKNGRYQRETTRHGVAIERRASRPLGPRGIARLRMSRHCRFVNAIAVNATTIHNRLFIS